MAAGLKQFFDLITNLNKYLALLALASVCLAIGFDKGHHQSQSINSAKHKIPVVSIDSVYKNAGKPAWDFHALRLTKAMSIMLDSLSRDSVLEFVPNYRLKDKVKSDYIISALLSIRPAPGSSKRVAHYRGFLTDVLTNEKLNDMGCSARNEIDLSCFSYDPTKPDSTDYTKIRISMIMGFQLKYLVPFREILTPVNIENKVIKSFSIDEFIRVDNSEDSDIAINLTHLLNNIMIFNQSTFKRRVYKNNTKYNYNNNYALKKKQKSNIVIQPRLRRDSEGNYQLVFFFKGKDVNLDVPQKIQTTFILNRKRLIDGDYSEVMLKVGPVIGEFRLMNLTL